LNEAVNALAKAVTDQGLSVEEYDSILEVAQNDPDVREKIRQRIRPSAQDVLVQSVSVIHGVALGLAIGHAAQTVHREAPLYAARRGRKPNPARVAPRSLSQTFAGTHRTAVTCHIRNTPQTLCPTARAKARFLLTVSRPGIWNGRTSLSTITLM
jgi:uncharacterized protein DUF4168